MTAAGEVAAALVATRFSGVRDSAGFGCVVALRGAIAAAIRAAEAAARTEERAACEREVERTCVAFGKAQQFEAAHGAAVAAAAIRARSVAPAPDGEGQP